MAFTPHASAAAQKPAGLAIGERIGSYVVQRELARGGMGVVFEAVHESLGQRAAVKVLAAELAQDPKYPEFVERFFDEARAITRLQHPGIVRIFDQGQLPSGTVYILMEFLDGESMLSRIEKLAVRSARIPLPDALRWTRQVASAISEAHQRSILHRDLKPGNIILVPDPDNPGTEVAKLIDFGIARFLDSPYHRTTAGTILGTPAYMSPEQCRGEAVDDRADVYALGTILYEMLSGQTPFDGSPSTIMVKKVLEDPPPLELRATDVPPSVYKFVHQLLNRQSAARPAMPQVVAQLKQLESRSATPFSSEPGAATLVMAGGQQSGVQGHAARERPSRRKLVAALMVAGALLLSGILAWWLVGSR